MITRQSRHSVVRYGLPAFDASAVTVDLEKGKFIRLKFLSMTLSFSESCICTLRWIKGDEYRPLKEK